MSELWLVRQRAEALLKLRLRERVKVDSHDAYISDCMVELMISCLFLGLTYQVDFDVLPDYDLGEESEDLFGSRCSVGFEDLALVIEMRRAITHFDLNLSWSVEGHVCFVP